MLTAPLLERQAHYRKKFSFALVAFCLMDNHVHPAVTFELADGRVRRVVGTDGDTPVRKFVPKKD